MLELHLCPLPAKGRLDRNEPPEIVITRFPCMIGRSSRCDERIEDLMISRRHCRFILRDNWVWIEDLHSRNGTLLNGERVTGAMPLGEGDVLLVGNQVFQVRVQNAAVAAAPVGINMLTSHESIDCEAAAITQ
jgi:pSer/pThr/pTyr-binding forkhead associated (FHA) protein